MAGQIDFKVGASRHLRQQAFLGPANGKNEERRFA
jgi:hypothetical protein